MLEVVGGELMLEGRNRCNCWWWVAVRGLKEV